MEAVPTLGWIALTSIKKMLSHDNQAMGRDLNRGPPRYEAGMLITRRRSSVKAFWGWFSGNF
jgi:hypothetical protein